MTALVFFLVLWLTACQAIVQRSKGEGGYELKRSLIMPNYWEVTLNENVSKLYDAVLEGFKDLNVKVYSKQVDSLSAIVEGFSADATEYSVRLSYESQSVTLIRLKAGITGDRTLSVQFFQAIEKHLS